MFTISVPIILSTFFILFIAELPDKTTLASLVLATKYKPAPVVVGACLAMLVQTIVAVVAGSFLTLLPAQPVRIAAGLGFLAFAYFALRRKEEKNLEEEKEEVEEIKKKNTPAWLASFLVVFAAEWGDLSQLATAGLVARIGHPLSVGIGSVLGLWTVICLAVLVGSQLNRFISAQKLTIISGILFAVVGVLMIVSVIYKV